jgi:hypothetical protein
VWFGFSQGIATGSLDCPQVHVEWLKENIAQTIRADARANQRQDNLTLL